MNVSLLLVVLVSAPDEDLIVLDVIAPIVDCDGELKPGSAVLIVDTSGPFTLELEEIMDV